MEKLKELTPDEKLKVYNEIKANMINELKDNWINALSEDGERFKVVEKEILNIDGSVNFKILTSKLMDSPIKDFNCLYNINRYYNPIKLNSTIGNILTSIISIYSNEIKQLKQDIKELKDGR